MIFQSVVCETFFLNYGNVKVSELFAFACVQTLIIISSLMASSMLFLRPIDCTQPGDQGYALSYCFLSERAGNSAV